MPRVAATGDTGRLMTRSRTMERQRAAPRSKRRSRTTGSWVKPLVKPLVKPQKNNDESLFHPFGGLVIMSIQSNRVNPRIIEG